MDEDSYDYDGLTWIEASKLLEAPDTEDELAALLTIYFHNDDERLAEVNISRGMIESQRSDEIIVELRFKRTNPGPNEDEYIDDENGDWSLELKGPTGKWTLDVIRPC